ncbi:LysR family transcriptional regulator [uncultured Enterobacter sp.]|uniref:LysR family transcriptional regulator n=1 Tax=uncultured Enterobacter sp. TaxID=238202 RepID=UPI0025FF52FF|nr:LysR family transcriptional regulator [uncultured Enterobacter sp.]
MRKERSIPLEAIRVLDAIDRCGSFAAAANELGKVPSSMSYTVQKLEADLDAMLFDRSGHRTKFTATGKIFLERGRVLLSAADQLVAETRALASGWETEITVAVDTLVPVQTLYSLVERMSKMTDTRLRLRTEVLAGSWECLQDERADLIISSMNPDFMISNVKSLVLQDEYMLYVAHPQHPIHHEKAPFSEEILKKYRAIAVSDTAQRKPVTYRLFDKQPRLSVSTMPEKRDALLAGLGIGTMPESWIKEDVASGKLKIISAKHSIPVKLGLSWRRDSIGKAKSWLIEEIPKLFPYSI